MGELNRAERLQIMLTPAELTRLIVPHGTTAIISDSHEIGNVLGIPGIDMLLSASAVVTVALGETFIQVAYLAVGFCLYLCRQGVAICATTIFVPLYSTLSLSHLAFESITCGVPSGRPEKSISMGGKAIGSWLPSTPT